MRTAFLSLLLVATLARAATESQEVPPAAPEQRITVDLNGIWKFFPAFDEIRDNHAFFQAGGIPEGVQSTGDRANAGWIEPSFDDSLWWDIAVPASWNTQFNDLWSYEGTGWYRKQINVPSEWRDKRVVLVFDGANYRTVVYVNGAKAGEHDGGYTRFQFPIDDYVRVGETNTIAVAVDNESRLDRVPMERHDWWDHGGIYRPVRIEVTNRSYLDDAVITTDTTAPVPKVHVAATVRTAASRNAGWYIVARLLDAGGVEVVSARTRVHSKLESRQHLDLAVPSARLWSPSDPYLYSLVLELHDASADACRDTWRTHVGIRTIQIEGDRLLVNGAPFLVKGVNRYENYPDSGMTSSAENLDKDIALIKDLGANAVRCHYTYAPATYDALDRAGLFAVCEVPLYQWGRPGHSDKNLDAAKKQLEEIIRTLGNHPSVMMWSVSNENRIRPREPGPEHARLSQMVVLGNKALVDLAHKLDPTRPVIEPSNTWPDDVVLAKTDLNSVNLYIGVPSPTIDGLQTLPQAIREKINQLRQTHPHKPILVTEFGSWALRGLKTPYFPGEPYQAELLRIQWDTLMTEPAFAGAFVWCFADSDVHRKFTGIYEMRCAYGLFDINRHPKESAGVLRQLWKGQP